MCELLYTINIESTLNALMYFFSEEQREVLMTQLYE